jgi:hypothetical protein
MKYIVLFVLLFGGIALFFSCGSEGSKSYFNKNLKIEQVKYHKKSAGCNTSTEKNCAEIKIEFPRVTFPENKVVEEKINKSITTLFSQDILGSTESIDFEIMMDGFIQEYESFKQEFPDTHQSWIIERIGEVQLNKANILSVDFTDYSYTGGAHPNTQVIFKNFNLNNGEEIKLDELISKENQIELNQMAEAEFRQLKNLNTGNDLGKAGFWFENNQFSLNDNFLTTDSSLVFYYNNYEITAYAFGPTELKIPYSRIEPLIEAKSLLKDLIK